MLDRQHSSRRAPVAQAGAAHWHAWMLRRTCSSLRERWTAFFLLGTVHMDMLLFCGGEGRWAGSPCGGRSDPCLARNLCISWPSPFCTDMDALMEFKRSFTNGEEVLAEWSPNGNPCDWDGVVCYFFDAVQQL